MEELDADTGNIIEKIDSWLDGLLSLLPNIGVAIAVLAAFVIIGYAVARLIRGRAAKRDRHSLGEVAGALIKWGIIIAGGMLAITIVVPSIKPGDLFAGLGVSSVAIGFAFKDILQNLLAGILILLRQPFAVGDQIVSGSHEGTVEKIETRATFLKTYDGQRVVIPNSQIYTDAVVVKTAFEQIRSEYDIGIGCNDSWDKAKELILEAAKSCEGVAKDPAPEVIPIAIADSSNNIRLRWWTKSDRASVIHTFGRVIEAVCKKLDENAIDMPYPTQVVLFHDQTEEVDGNRSRQREGWPAGSGDVPKSARMSEAIGKGSRNSEAVQNKDTTNS
jgi:small conductance mechanosensitive channel